MRALRRLVVLVLIVGVGWLVVTSIRGRAQDQDDEDDIWEDDGFDGEVAAGNEPARFAAAAPPAEQRSPSSAATTTDAEPERRVKGNVRHDGEKIYHLPGDPAYERTNAEQTFATAEEAEAAGFRRAGH
jgi:hypothetical protein